MEKRGGTSLIRQLWLEYFNQVLYRKGYIDDAAYRQMLLKIRGIQRRV